MTRLTDKGVTKGMLTFCFMMAILYVLDYYNPMPMDYFTAMFLSAVAVGILIALFFGLEE